MKKLFISCPMNGRTEEAIKKSMELMHKEAERIFGKELEVIPTYIEEDPPKEILGKTNIHSRRIWYLGKSIELLAKADYFIGVSDSARFESCNFEKTIAEQYGIKIAVLDIADVLF